MPVTESENGKLGPEREPIRINIPGFISDVPEIGLGDVIKRATSTFGIRTCGGCEKRAQRLNRWVVFSPSHRTEQ